MSRYTKASLYLAACILPQVLALGKPPPGFEAFDGPPGMAEEDKLAFVHIPFNFGHTVERFGFFQHKVSYLKSLSYIFGLGAIKKQHTWTNVKKDMKPGGDPWGSLHPDLLQISNVTGCHLYFTPPKYWPEDTVKKVIGNRKTFGIIRDPYERLVSMFRGNMKGYGASLDKYYKKCDVNAAVQYMVQPKEHLRAEATPDHACTWIPQADYFDEPNGIQIALDQRSFPDSMNKVFKDHGYPDDYQIDPELAFHVNGCGEVGTWNLTAETKAMVRERFPRDFALICKLFGYCEEGEDTCVTGIPKMCPSWVDKGTIRINT